VQPCLAEDHILEARDKFEQRNAVRAAFGSKPAGEDEFIFYLLEQWRDADSLGQAYFRKLFLSYKNPRGDSSSPFGFGAVGFGGMRIATLLFFISLMTGWADEVECYWCKEEVKAGARKCKHCGEDPYGGEAEGRVARAVNELEEWAENRKGPWPWQRGWTWQWVVMPFLCFFFWCYSPLADGFAWNEGWIGVIFGIIIWLIY
jgi:hypothetical protein